MHFYRQPASGSELQEDQRTSILTCCIIVIIIPTLAVFLRFWARIIRPGVKICEWILQFKYTLAMGSWVCLGWDDWLLLATLAVSNALLGIFLAERPRGVGLHIQLVEPTNIVTILKLYWSGEVIYIFQACLYRLSTIFLYLRLFGTNRKFSISALVLAAVIVIFFILNVAVLVTECDPVATAWNPLLKGHCRNPVTFYITVQSVSMVLDLLVLVLPLPMIRALNLKRSQKLLLVLVFTLGYGYGTADL